MRFVASRKGLARVQTNGLGRVAVAYTRVSTVGQVNEGVSLEAQHERIRAYCAASGWALSDGDFFTDAGISGKRMGNRPGLRSALDRSCEAAAVLVVYSISRLARSVRDTLDIAERLSKSGADLAAVADQIDTSSASGKMIFRILAVIAEFERDIISERTKAALHHKRAQRQVIGQVPYGRRIGGDGLVEVDEAEVKLIGFIDSMRRSGCSLRTIAKLLTSRGDRTKNGSPAWSHTSVDDILKRVKRGKAQGIGGEERIEDQVAAIQPAQGRDRKLGFDTLPDR